MPSHPIAAQRSQQTQDSHSGQKPQRYRTLDLVNAQNFGWDRHHKLTQSESQVMVFIAKRGALNEPGMAFAWFPLWGQEWWANLMGMNPTTLRTALNKLRTKGLITNLSGSAKDRRFSLRKGYGIHPKVMAECRQWYDDREWMTRFQAPDTLGECSTLEHECSEGEHGCSQQEHRTPHSLTPVRDSEVHTHEETPERETHGLTSASSPSGGSQSDPQGDPMRNQGDGWDQPQDGPDDFAVPKEAREKPERYKRPSSRLMDQFHACWLKSREKRPGLALDWSVKVIFQTNLKRLLETEGELVISGMITEFFRLVDQRQITLKNEDLWKDFWYNRGKLVKLAQGRVQTLSTPQAEIDEHNRRVMEEMRKRPLRKEYQ